MHLIRLAVIACLAGLSGSAAFAETVSGNPAKNQKPAAEATRTAEMRAERHAAAAAVKSWTIQFRYLNLAQLRAAPVDMIVMDHAPHPKKGIEIPFQKVDIDALKVMPDGKRRLVIAYLSIGEAERYRYYWKPQWDAQETRPAWLGPENPSWPGNYPVKFRDPEWQSIIFGSPESYLDRILGAGFDGIYLDRADVYQEFGDTDELEDAMAGFVTRIAAHARRINPQFIVILQNAEELTRFSSVRRAIDAISKEDLLFGHNNSPSANPPAMVAGSLRHLRQAKKSGLVVFLLEYVTDPDQRQAALRLASKEGFLLRFVDRLLSTPALDDAAAVPVPAPPPP